MQRKFSVKWGIEGVFIVNSNCGPWTNTIRIIRELGNANNPDPTIVI